MEVFISKMERKSAWSISFPSVFGVNTFINKKFSLIPYHLISTFYCSNWLRRRQRSLWRIVASHGIWVRLLLPPYRGCLSVFDLDSMNILRPHSTNQMATWNNSSRYSEAILIQWNDTFYKPFGQNEKQRYAAHARTSRLFYRLAVSCPVV